MSESASHGAPIRSNRHRHMARKFPLHPKHPERICWGCDRYCSKEAMGCGNGSDRTQHPADLLGEDWYLYGDWGLEVEDAPAPEAEKDAKKSIKLEKAQ